MAVIEELGYKSGLYDTYIRTESSIRHSAMLQQPGMTHAFRRCISAQSNGLSAS
jgi:hypothetical protein